MNVLARACPLTYSTVKDLLDTMETGEKLVYHIGSLMHDRSRGANFQTVHGVALAAYEAYERGEVTLVQRKIAPITFQYIAVKRTPARNAAKVEAFDDEDGDTL